MSARNRIDLRAHVPFGRTDDLTGLLARRAWWRQRPAAANTARGRQRIAELTREIAQLQAD